MNGLLHGNSYDENCVDGPAKVPFFSLWLSRVF